VQALVERFDSLGRDSAQGDHREPALVGADRDSG